MLSVVRDAHGNLIVACDWMPVDKAGRYDPNGLYIWVEQLEMNMDVHGMNIVRLIIQDIAERCPNAVGAYWKRRDKPKVTKPHAYRRNQLLKEVLV